MGTDLKKKLNLFTSILCLVLFFGPPFDVKAVPSGVSSLDNMTTGKLPRKQSVECIQFLQSFGTAMRRPELTKPQPSFLRRPNDRPLIAKKIANVLFK